MDNKFQKALFLAVLGIFIFAFFVVIGIFKNIQDTEIRDFEYREVSSIKKAYPELNSLIYECIDSDYKITRKEYNKILNKRDEETEKLIEREKRFEIERIKRELKW